MQGDPLVSIKCLVYNHEPFLRQCLDGFVMQQTSFPFEAIVHDDASTDGSAAIIREYAEKYPGIIKPIYETENQWGKGTISKTMNAAIHPNSKYIAVCEGDDYWTDPLKLQNQVDIMEADGSIGLVHSAADIYDQSNESFFQLARGLPLISFEDELMSNKCYTLTSCFRKDLYFDFVTFITSHDHNPWKMGDYPLWLYISYFSKASYLPKSTGVYRILKTSASHDPDAKKQADFELSAFDVRVFFAKTFNRCDLLKTITTNLVYTMQRISINTNQTVKYDIWDLYKKYGFNDKYKLFVKHYFLQNMMLRNLYLKFLQITNEDTQSLRI